MPSPMQSAEAFGGFIVGDTDYLSILAPEIVLLIYMYD